MPVTEVYFSIRLKFELPALLCDCYIDSCVGQPLQMIVVRIWIDHVNRLTATFQPVFDKRKQHAIFFIITTEECTGMTRSVEL